MTRFVGKLPIKGKTGTHDIFEFIHEEEEATLVMEHPSELLFSFASLELRCGEIVASVDESHPTLTIGRLPANDLVLRYAGVSRMHAKIEHRKGKFVLVDASSNGTYVHIEGQDVVFLRHDELQLHGEGIICPGRSATPQSPGAIHYCVRS